VYVKVYASGGVPQGSILSAAQSLYPDDTPQSHDVHLALFEDDTCLCYRTQGGLCSEKTPARSKHNGCLV
jgi:hypothetical protein